MPHTVKVKSLLNYLLTVGFLFVVEMSRNGLFP